MPPPKSSVPKLSFKKNVKSFDDDEPSMSIHFKVSNSASSDELTSSTTSVQSTTTSNQPMEASSTLENGATAMLGASHGDNVSTSEATNYKEKQNTTNRVTQRAKEPVKAHVACTLYTNKNMAKYTSNTKLWCETITTDTSCIIKVQILTNLRKLAGF